MHIKTRLQLPNLTNCSSYQVTIPTSFQKAMARYQIFERDVLMRPARGIVLRQSVAGTLEWKLLEEAYRLKSITIPSVKGYYMKIDKPTRSTTGPAYQGGLYEYSSSSQAPRIDFLEQTNESMMLSHRREMSRQHTSLGCHTLR